MSQQASDYGVVDEHDKEKFEQRVKKLIAQGWSPHGSISVVAPVIDGSPAPLFCQTMVKIG